MAGVIISGFNLFVVSTAIIFSVNSVALGNPILTTSLGDVVGSQHEKVGQTVETYYGIPFAKPPTGARRFKAPEAAEAWAGQRDGTVKPSACWQTDDTSFKQAAVWNANTDKSEDCLYLNVWRRAGASSTPIMVWIHGGGFHSGSPVLHVYDGSDLAARRDVIVVTIAYRLGPLGFMYLEGNADVPGNAGLLDQVMALQWVYDNAENLGGSKDSITLFGQGAGAASVGMHMLSPLSKNLFNNAIMESGSPTNVWAVAKKPRIVSKVNALIDTFCPGTPDILLLPCLQAVDPEDLTEEQWNLDNQWYEVPFAPIVDNAVLVEDPQDSVSRGNIETNKNLIVGYNEHEGTIPAVYTFPNELPLNGGGHIGDRDTFRNMILAIAQNNTDLQTDILEIYSREMVDANERRMRIVEASMGDYLFKCGQVEFAKKYADLEGRVYVYSYEEKYSTSPWPGWMGVPHRDEIEAVFGQPLNPGATNDQEEKEISKEIQSYWTSLARHGSPRYRDVDWLLFTTRYQDYAKIRSKGTRIVRRPRKQTCEVWDRFRHFVGL